jgi:hypothetical protein
MTGGFGARRRNLKLHGGTQTHRLIRWLLADDRLGIGLGEPGGEQERVNNNVAFHGFDFLMSVADRFPVRGQFLQKVLKNLPFSRLVLPQTRQIGGKTL